MDCRTGEIIDREELRQRILSNPEDAKYFKEVPYQRTKPKTGRNAPCPCGSGIKFKKCCYMKEAGNE